MAFSQPVRREFRYSKGRNDLIRTDQWTGGAYDWTWTYDYDPIGNRRSSRAWDVFNDPGAASQQYVRNALNQYAQVRLRSTPERFQTYGYDADGNLVEQFVAADMNCDGTLGFDDINPMVLAISDPAAWQAAYPNCDILNGDINGDGALTMGDITPFVALISGGEGAHGLRAEFAWDGENRLVRVGPADGAMRIGAQRIEFVYDYLGRRVELRVSAVPDVQPLRWELIKRRRFVWSGWLMLVEVDAGVDTPAENNPLRRYTWGLDLGGVAGSAVAAGYGAPALQLVGYGAPALQAAGHGDPALQDVGRGGPALQGAGGVGGAPALQGAGCRAAALRATGGVGCLPDGCERPPGAGPGAG